MPVGQGTERVEETLARLFPEAPLARLDRDTTGARGALHAVLERVRRGEARILVGTQMLTKGHDFPDVSLVVILDADQGLFASDYRATERLAQTITQVAGRAGRASRLGEVMVQTSFPEHPLLGRLMSAGYEGFAATALDERRDARWPPYSRLALFRAEAKDRARLDRFLEAAADQARAARRRGGDGARPGCRADRSARRSFPRASIVRVRLAGSAAALSEALAPAGGDGCGPALVDRRRSAGSRLRGLGYTRGASPHETPRTLKNLVDTWLRQALARLPESMVPPSGRDVCIEVQRPKDARRGDFASNLALRLASAARRDPRPLAEAIISALPADAALAKVEIAGAGFLNFFLSESSYHGEIRRALRDAGEFGKSDVGQGRAVRVEVASVDPEGPLHAGHARQAAFGASVAALLEAVGYRVVRECRIAPASRTLAQCAAGTHGARADGRAADLAALRRELSEFGVTFDAWGLGGWEGPGGCGDHLGESGAVEGSGSAAAPASVLRGGRKRPARAAAGRARHAARVARGGRKRCRAAVLCHARERSASAF